jgi:hypothetical protein
MSKNKRQRRLKKEFRYLHNKVEEMEKDRDGDRSWESKAIIKRHKKMKLRIKDKLEQLEELDH